MYCMVEPGEFSPVPTVEANVSPLEGTAQGVIVANARDVYKRQQTGRRILVAAGVVAANRVLRQQLQSQAEQQGMTLYLPPLSLCGDNGAMIACQAYYEYQAGHTAGLEQNCFATLSICLLYTSRCV